MPFSLTLHQSVTPDVAAREVLAPALGALRKLVTIPGLSCRSSNMESSVITAAILVRVGDSIPLHDPGIACAPVIAIEEGAMPVSLDWLVVEHKISELDI